MDTTDELPRAKKRKMMNRICDGVVCSPPKCADGILCNDGILSFDCPSRDYSTTHKVFIKANPLDKKNIVLECDCKGGYDGNKSQSCVHINSAIIYLCKTYVDNSYEFNETKDKYISTNKAIADLSDELNKLQV